MREDRPRASRGMRDRNLRRDHARQCARVRGDRRGLSFFWVAYALGACRESQPACGQRGGNVSLGGAKERGESPMAQESLPGTTDRRLAGLLALLAGNATILISGPRIAKEIGVSRSTVWAWVQRLRELGVKVKGRHATGYFLEEVPDILTPDMLKQRLKGSLFGKRIFHFFKTDSTNRVALELGHAGEPEGAIVLAEEQTAGRGRAGRKWHSERAAGIYATLLLRPKLAPVQAPLWTIMAEVLPLLPATSPA